MTDRASDSRPPAWKTALDVASAWFLGAGVVVVGLAMDPAIPRSSLAILAVSALVVAAAGIRGARRPLLVAIIAPCALVASTVATGLAGTTAFCLAGVVIASAALVQPQGLGRLRRREVQRVVLAFPLLVAAQVIWALTSSVAIAAVLLAAGAATVAASHLAPERWKRIQAASWPTRRRPHRSDRDAPARREARDQFVSLPTAARRRRIAPGLFIVLALIGAIAVARRPEPAPPPATASEALDALGSTAFSSLPAFRAQDGALRLEQELEAAVTGLTFDPTIGSTLADYPGELVTVSDGVRVTASSDCDCPTVTMWLVGGSAAFGLGQRNDHTVASDLVDLAAENGIRLDVVAMGTPLWSLWPSHLAVTALLASGAPKPDLVVYYGGFDDVLATVALDSAGQRVDHEPPMATSDQVKSLRDREGPAGQGEELGSWTARWYRGQMQSIAGQLGEQGIETAFVLQPDLVGSGGGAAAPNPAADALLERTDLVTALQRTEDDLKGTVIDLRNALTGHEETFYDVSNVNEEGAALAAGALHRRLVSRYEEIVR